jgi:LssY-like putative type I secretion system component LssY
MFGVVFRIIWRILILFIGAYVLWLTVFKVYPYADTRLPTFAVLLLIYCLFAYLVIPTLVRLFRLVIKPNHLPVYAVSADGWSSDPVNIAIICKNKAQLKRIMRKAGWSEADPVTVSTTIKFALSIAFGTSYPTAPFSNLYLLGRRQDIGYQIQTGNKPSARHRHHVRLWQLPVVGNDTHEDNKFWHLVLKRLFTKKQRQIWVAAATHDIAPFAIRISNLQITHKIDQNTNLERDYVIQTLKDSKHIRRIETIKTGEPLSFRGQTFGVRIVVDGQLKVIELK